MSSNPPIAVTEARSFCALDGVELLTINAGVAVSDTLEQVSLLLSCATRLVGDDSGNNEDRVAIQYLLEISSAMVDASLAGIWAKEKALYAAS